MQRDRDRKIFVTICYIPLAVFTLMCLIPFVMVIASSFSSEESILTQGYSLIPRDFSLRGYELALRNPESIGLSYLNTIGVTLAGTALGVLVNIMTGYCLQKRDFKWRNGFSFFG